MKLCPSCKKPLGPGYPNRKFCSKNCRTYSGKKPCEHCGKHFPVPRRINPRTGHTGRFCSVKCASLWIADHQELLPKVSIRCRRCRKKLKEVHANRQFCSVDCRDGATMKQCAECGQWFKSHQPAKTRPATRFCSASCKWKWNNRNSGKRSLLPTEQEKELATQIPMLRLQHKIYTGRRLHRNARHRYQVDLAVPRLKLAIEMDGGIHRQRSRKSNDQKKDAELAALGWTVLRFYSTRGKHNLESVRRDIESTISRLEATQVTQ